MTYDEAISHMKANPGLVMTPNGKAYRVVDVLYRFRICGQPCKVTVELLAK